MTIDVWEEVGAKEGLGGTLKVQQKAFNKHVSIVTEM